LMTPVTRALQKIPDSDQKKNLQVKLKRFAYSLSFPSELMSHRWRIYYSPHELQELCTAEFIQHCDMSRMFDGMLNYTRAADGRDILSRSLYSDYQTLVGFYLCRLGLLRAFAIESRLPLLDHRLVEYAAKIPSRLKIRRLSETKYIYKKALEDILPREILYNRPKLGHSVPMKNWLREGDGVRPWVADVLSDAPFKDRGLFRTEFVRSLMDEHVRRTHNHSHRLWALIVLEFWLRSCLEEAPG
jgi:asparagine synthase (glutamine-hydrolysing)